ncbi:MAG: glycosyltransferase family 2 protein [Deltaproteobacteria bacterium]|nr:glycosyltransferase family 2 protein [Deltaproteobacteria bacterium]
MRNISTCRPMRKLAFLSVVVPCHNEQEVLPTTHERLRNLLNHWVADHKIAAYEVVYVDNGSTDDTLRVLKGLFERDPQVRIVALRRNFGYQGSITAGLHHAHGDAVVTIDADLQDPPEKIDEMLTHFKEGYDLVLGVRTDRSSDSFLKRIFSEGYYRLLKWMRVEAVHNHGDFRLMARSLVEEFKVLVERNRLIRAMILQLESRRTAGRTKFGLHSLVSLSFDGIVSFSYIPLRVASLAGLLMCLFAAFGVVWVLYIKLSTDVLPGWASTVLPILGIGGLQLLIMGIMGEYIGRLYIEVKRRPLFVVREVFTHHE